MLSSFAQIFSSFFDMDSLFFFFGILLLLSLLKCFALPPPRFASMSALGEPQGSLLAAVATAGNL